jgi:hypothetical protein
MEAVREAARIAQEKIAEAAMVAKDLAAEAMDGMSDDTPAGKVRVATNNEPWGPTGTQMGEIADMTFGHDVREITGALRERLQAKGANWRYCYKALNIVEYLVATCCTTSAPSSASNTSTVRARTRG